MDQMYDCPMCEKEQPFLMNQFAMPYPMIYPMTNQMMQQLPITPMMAITPLQAETILLQNNSEIQIGPLTISWIEEGEELKITIDLIGFGEISQTLSAKQTSLELGLNAVLAKASIKIGYNVEESFLILEGTVCVLAFKRWFWEWKCTGFTKRIDL